jgi:hypothetical protein
MGSVQGQSTGTRTFSDLAVQWLRFCFSKGYIPEAILLESAGSVVIEWHLQLSSRHHLVS